MIDEIKQLWLNLSTPGSSNELAKCDGLSEAASGSRFTLPRNWDAPCPRISLDDYQDRAS